MLFICQGDGYEDFGLVGCATVTTARDVSDVSNALLQVLNTARTIQWVELNFVLS